MILQYFLWALLAYFIYRFVFNFIIPVVRASRDIKRQVNEFKTRMQSEQEPYQQRDYTPSPTPKSGNTSKAGDYIEFEEIR